MQTSDQRDFLVLARLAIELVEHAEELLDARVGDAVPDRLALAPGGDDALIPHLGQMLRQGRLRQPHRLGQGGHVGLAPLHELAQDHQPPLVGERPQDVRDLGRLLLKAFKIGLGTRHHFHRLHKGFLILEGP